MIGVNQRTTMDMDATIRGLPVNEELLTNILAEILGLESDDEIVFSLQGLKSIREKSQYEDYCATIFADYGKIHAVLKVDITIGGAITPREVVNSVAPLFSKSVRHFILREKTGVGGTWYL